jgi:hypothetical protein
MLQVLFCQGFTSLEEKDYGMITLNFANHCMAMQKKCMNDFLFVQGVIFFLQEICFR